MPQKHTKKTQISTADLVMNDRQLTHS